MLCVIEFQIRNNIIIGLMLIVTFIVNGKCLLILLQGNHEGGAVWGSSLDSLGIAGRHK